MTTNVSTEDFLAVLFADIDPSEEAICVTHPKGDTFWNFYSDDPKFIEFCEKGPYDEVDEEDAWYVCISSVNNDGPARRKRVDLMNTYAIVLDDIGTKVAPEDITVEPSWIMETSEGNYQYGYLLVVTDECDKVAAVVDAMIERGLSDEGAKGAYRVVRVPNSRNLKEGNDGWLSRVTLWEPERFWELDDLIAEFGLTEDDLTIKQKRTVVAGDGTTRAVVNTTAGFASLAPYQVREILSFLPKDWSQNYPTWELVGKAMRRLDRDDYRIAGHGLDIWTEWSGAGKGYDGANCAAKWHELIDDPDLEAKPYTIGSVIEIAKENGWSRKSDAVTRIDEDGQAVTADYREFGLEGELRKFIGDKTLRWHFDTDNDPVLWDNLIAAEPSCFVEGKGNKCYINANGEQVPITPDRELDVMEQQFGAFCDMDALTRHINSRKDIEGCEDFSTDAKIKAFYRDVPKAIMTVFWSVVTRNKIANSLQLQVDMFTDKVVPSTEIGKCTFTIPFRGFAHVSGVDDRFVDDYKEHNPRFDEIIDFLIMSRFASSRKNCFLWLHADSNWGKGFLFAKGGVFGQLKIVQSMSVKEIEMALEGKPLGLDKYALINNWVLHVDEFKTINAEIKMLEDSLTAAPKNMLRFEAPIYAKVFTSAEDVAALTGEAGIEDQFASRFSYIRCRGRLSDRELHRDNMRAYTRSVSAYAKARIEAAIARFRAMGPDQASVGAEAWLREFHERNGIARHFRNLDDTVGAVAGEVADVVQKFCNGLLGSTLGGDFRMKAVYSKVMLGVPEKFVKRLAESCEVVEYRGENCVVLTGAAALVKEWIEHGFSYSESKKMGYKTRAICTELDAILFPDRCGETTRVKKMNDKWLTTRGTLVAKDKCVEV